MLRPKLLSIFTLCATLGWAGSAFAASWVSPMGDGDPESKWTTEAGARDGNISSYASDNSRRTGWGAYLNLTLTTAINSGRVRAMADYGYNTVDKVQIDVYKDGAWVTVLDGAVADAAWSEIAFAAGSVSQARFRFHYLNANYIFWLYEFQFYEEAAQSGPPTCATTAATSRQQTTAALHGALTNDGGAPCEYRFQWGQTDQYGSASAWTGSKNTGDALSLFIGGLTAGQTYHFRAQARNSYGESSGGDLTFQAGAETDPWFSPNAYTDASGIWENETNVLDDDVSSAAKCYHEMGTGQWGPFLELNFAVVTADRMRLYAKKDANIDSVDVDVYKFDFCPF